MKRFLSVITLLVALVSSVFAENHNKKYEKGVEICQQIANDYNIEVEIKKVAALPNNVAALPNNVAGVCMRKGEGKYVMKLKVKEFSNSNELCKFVNDNFVDVETIVVLNGILQLFYWE